VGVMARIREIVIESYGEGRQLRQSFIAANVTNALITVTLIAPLIVLDAPTWGWIGFAELLWISLKGNRWAATWRS
jgi:hypothetical protein